ncbi:Hypothetical protein NTJ_03997 [Nesidiocoris tenuis]|uniref:MATH domain-containing protein n=1 Tax=Nesidiocoris tenuis TaxID=355587 RepID=A0ABN7AIJ3_9HEMI|nr:Hypothetical protein NTJ_03997 [Nesidiocoris tenuis]
MEWLKWDGKCEGKDEEGGQEEDGEKAFSSNGLCWRFKILPLSAMRLDSTSTALTNTTMSTYCPSLLASMFIYTFHHHTRLTSRQHCGAWESLPFFTCCR